MSVARIDSPTAQVGIARPPAKYLSVDFCLRANDAPKIMIKSRYPPTTT
jgi:hypothetical protein